MCELVLAVICVVWFWCCGLLRGFVCLGWDLVLICLVLFVGCSSLRWLVGFVVLVCYVFVC